MKIQYNILAAFLLATSLHAAPPADPYNELFPQGTQITFIGDSITHGFTDPTVVKGDHYHALFQAYFSLRFPGRDLWTKNSGRSGGKASTALSERMDNRDVYKVVPGVADFPDVAFIMFGMNDGGSLGYIGNTPSESSKQGRRNTYVSKMQGIINDLESKGVKVVILSPTMYDEFASKNVPVANGYNDELAIYTQLAGDLAASNDLLFIDVHTYMTQKNLEQQAIQPGFSYTRDRVHPRNGGHALVLYQILKKLGLESDVFNVRLRAGSAPSVTSAVNASVFALAENNGTLTWFTTENSLPFPIKRSSYTYDRAFLDTPFVEDFNQQLLSVENLAAGDYRLFINGTEIATYTAAELASGIDLSQKENTPQFQAAFAIREQLYDIEMKNITKRDLNSTRLNMESHYGNPSFSDPAALADLKAQDWDLPDVPKILGYLQRERDERAAAGLNNGGFFGHISGQTNRHLADMPAYNNDIANVRTSIEALPTSRTFTYSLVPADGNGGGGGNGGGTPSDGSSLDLSTLPVSSYSDQDKVGSSTVSADGATLTLLGNKWKSFAYNHNVTADTVMEVTLDAANTGEGILVGLDNDNNHRTGRTLFQLGGSQTINDAIPFSPAYSAGSGSVTFLIPLGTEFTGAMTQLVLVADDDANEASNASFSNIKIYEANSGGGGGTTVEIAAEDFESNTWTGGTGWSSSEWARSGTTFITAVSADGSSHGALIRGSGAGLTRSVDLSAHDSVELKVSIKRYLLEAGDSAILQFFDGVTWHDLETFTGNGGYNSYNYDLSAFTMAANGDQRLRLFSGMNDNTDYVYIDSIIFSGVIPAPTGPPSVIASEGFESNSWTGGSGWSDAGWSRVGKSNISSYPFSGTYGAQIKGAGASLTRSVNLANTTQVEIKVAIRCYLFEAGDSATLQFYDGANWIDLETFTSDTGFQRYTYDLSAVPMNPNGTQKLRLTSGMSDTGFQRYTYDLSAVPMNPNGTQKLRLTSGMSDTTDFTFIDAIEISGVR